MSKEYELPYTKEELLNLLGNIKNEEELREFIQQNGASAGGGHTDEEIRIIVAEWYQANKDAQLTKEDVDGWIAEYMTENPVSGVTTEQANTLWSLIQKMAFSEQLTDDEANSFKKAWGIITENIQATGITLDKTTLSFNDFSTQILKATVTPSNSTDKVTWLSSDTGIAVVSNGIVTPVSNGNCNITAATGNYSATCEVIVSIENEVLLQSISATYSGGNVNIGTQLSALTGISVIATYSDGSTNNVTGYELSGEILEGNNTITVTYQGKTTTFNVTGVPFEETVISGTSLLWEFGFINKDGVLTTEKAADGSYTSDFYDLNGARNVLIALEGTDVDVLRSAYFDADKNFISRELTAESTVPVGAVYSKVTITKESIGNNGYDGNGLTITLS